MKNTKQNYTERVRERWRVHRVFWIVKIPWVVLSLARSRSIRETKCVLSASTNLASKIFNCGLCVIRSMSFVCVVWVSEWVCVNVCWCLNMILFRPMQTEAHKERAKKVQTVHLPESTSKALIVYLSFLCLFALCFLFGLWFELTLAKQRQLTNKTVLNKHELF